MIWDVVIVGGGTAGCVLAARLSEDPDRRVLLLESGHDYPGGVDELPEDLRREQVAIPEPELMWYYGGALSDRVDREVAVVRGHAIGGSGAVNGTVFQRGLPDDYDAWGSSLWTYEAVLPYLRRTERDLDFATPIHGTEGPVPVRRFKREQWPPSQRAMYEAALACGYPTKLDLAEPDGSGIGAVPHNGQGVVRMSAALTYLQPARGRPNLQVRGDARVVGIRFADRRATGVEVRGSDGETAVVEAREVVLTCGGIETPHLLMTSGVGTADALARHGTEVVCDLPGVGKNLRDHPSIPLPVETPPGFSEDGRNHVMLVYTTEGSPRRNDMQIILCAVRMPDANGALSWPLTVVAMQQASDAIGEISLASPDPLVPPRIVFNYLESELDRNRVRDATRVMARLVAHPAFASIGVKRTAPADDVLASDALLDEWLVANLFTLFHTCGTCRMGKAGDPAAVVDDHGRLHGIEGLRIADLSIVPNVPRAATNATAFMLGERIADLFNEDTR